MPRSPHMSRSALVLLILLGAHIPNSAAARDKATARPSVPATASASAPAQLLPPLQKFAEELQAGYKTIPADRKQMLDKLALFVRTKRGAGEEARLLFVCTHNSRRSHMGQLFAAAAAAYYGVDKVETFSGGTEATAFNPRAVAAIERAGFTVANPGGDNPHYKVTFASNRAPIESFSKKYDDASNPKSDFVAVMTCEHADKNCPTVAGSTLRLPLHYEDPKASDGKPDESATYDARAKQIATEIFYAFSRVKG